MRFWFSLLFSVLLVTATSGAMASEAEPDAIETSAISDDAQAPAPKLGASGLPLPRFASLKANRVNLRVGPGPDHAILMRYLKAGLPIEIVREWDNWRKVRDWEGTEGWVHSSLLSGKRAVVVAPWSKGEGTQALLSMRSKPAADARMVAQLEPGASAMVEKCENNWCELNIAERKGWIEQDSLWGVYGGEPVKN